MSVVHKYGSGSGSKRPQKSRYVYLCCCTVKVNLKNTRIMLHVYHVLWNFLDLKWLFKVWRGKRFPHEVPNPCPPPPPLQCDWSQLKLICDYDSQTHARRTTCWSSWLARTWSHSAAPSPTHSSPFLSSTTCSPPRSCRATEKAWQFFLILKRNDTVK